MSQTAIIVVTLLIALAALILVMRGRAKPSSQDLPAAPGQNHGVAGSAASAVEDVAGPFIGIDVHGNFDGPPDDLTVIKGLGPKAAGQMKLLGITRYAQLGALDSAQAELLDQQMGVFRGRLDRDRWIEQARYLARGDRASFEELFGKLG